MTYDDRDRRTDGDPTIGRGLSDPAAEHVPPASNRRKMVLLAILLALLALVGYSTYYYLVNRRLPIPRLSRGEEEVAPPEYLYSISGPRGEDALTRPVGVAVGQNGLVYATDTLARTIRVFTTQGQYRFSFNTIEDGLNSTLGTPAHLAIDAQGSVYVSDRRRRAIYVFDKNGKYLRKIVPAGEDAKSWSPLGMAFDAEGNLYVTDVGVTTEHRVIVFGGSGTEILRFGSTAQANQMVDAPGKFYFPNGVVVAPDNKLMVGDSNNRRVQVFSTGGHFGSLIRTGGIPRGMVIDPEKRLYVVDALSHMVDVFDLEGKRIVSFGREGVGPGEFRYANDISLDKAGHIYVSDRENHQIQVWAWPQEGFEVPPTPETPAQWALCLSPLLLIPPLFLLRRKRWVVTADFIDALAEEHAVGTMQRRRWKWVTTHTVWAALDGRVAEDIDLGELVRAETHSDSDARDLVERMGVGYEMAALLVLAKRAKRICTQDERLASLAATLGATVYDAHSFMRKYGDSQADKPKGRE
ncbi:MAG: 6-bladed beta-propeller [Actinomycetota bacterium]|nr:6-bladed beta-propeller [Actinomycetota bacterium]